MVVFGLEFPEVNNRIVTLNDLQALADKVSEEMEKLAARLSKAETEITTLKGGISMVASAVAKSDVFDREAWNQMMDRCAEHAATNGSPASHVIADTMRSFKIVETDDGFRPVVIQGGKSEEV